jgi:hypothetical protein
MLQLTAAHQSNAEELHIDLPIVTDRLPSDPTPKKVSARERKKQLKGKPANIKHLKNNILK